MVRPPPAASMPSAVSTDAVAEITDWTRVRMSDGRTGSERHRIIAPAVTPASADASFQIPGRQPTGPPTSRLRAPTGCSRTLTGTAYAPWNPAAAANAVNRGQRPASAPTSGARTGSPVRQ